jgi:tetratricopeptide (TPR) repeat protein
MTDASPQKRSDAAPAPRARSSPADFDHWPAWLFFALILGLCVLVYLPALHGSLLWDDDGHVTRPDLRSWHGLFRIWFEIGATQQYYPVLHSAFWLEHRFWGDSVVGYHLLNVVLHATTAGLFGFFLRRLRLPGAWLAALLFALHPVCVESVAWISEQKNTLSAVIYLAAALAYLRYDEDRRTAQYWRATGWFVLALLTKTVTATLPAALLVVFWWRRGRLDWRRDVLPLLPWFVLSAAMGLLTAEFERDLIGAQGADFSLSLVERGLLAGRVFWFYLGKLAWPAGLTFIYPRWTVDAATGWQWLFPLAAFLLLGVLLWLRRRGPLAALLLFAGGLFPVLGFFNVFPFLYSYVADHFQYLASLAVFALAGAGLAHVLTRVPARVRLVGPSLLLAGLGALAWEQAGMYRDPFTLYGRTLARNPDCWMAHNNLAIALADSGRVEQAIPHLEAALKLKPDFAQAANNLGDDLLRIGRAPEAIPHLKYALKLQPNYPVAQRNLGMALATTGRTREAVLHFEQAVRLEPNYADAELHWAIGLTLTDRFAEAGPHFERAIALNPNSAYFFNTYGRALERAGQLDAAVTRYEEAVRLDPNYAEAHLNLAFVLRRLGRMPEAAIHFEEVQRLNPGLLKSN